VQCSKCDVKMVPVVYGSPSEDDLRRANEGKVQLRQAELPPGVSKVSSRLRVCLICGEEGKKSEDAEKALRILKTAGEVGAAVVGVLGIAIQIIGKGKEVKGKGKRQAKS
jgi:hypothetical protein